MEFMENTRTPGRHCMDNHRAQSYHEKVANIPFDETVKLKASLMGGIQKLVNE